MLIFDTIFPMASPIFSIAILIQKDGYLLPSTLDALKAQEEKRFEVLLIDATDSAIFRTWISEYPELSIQIKEAENSSLSSMLNQAVKGAKGAYLQFLFPGDRFLSPHTLSYLQELIDTNLMPECIYSELLLQEEGLAPHISLEPLNLKALAKGRFSFPLRSTCFLKKKIEDLGGFDLSFKRFSPFDFLCKLSLKPNSKIIYTRRVLIDAEREVPILSTSLEMMRILYRHFGLKAILRFLFAQDPLKLLQKGVNFVKRSFLE